MRTKTKNNPKTEKGYLKSIAWIPSSFLAGLSLCSLLCLAIIALHALPTASAESASSLVSLGVSPALSLSLTPENALSIPINPAGSGAYSSRKLTATVSTNNATGYTMTFSSGAGGTSLINSAAASNNDISPTSAAIASPNNLTTMNTWGFAVPKVQTNSTGLFPNDTSGFGNSYTEVTSEETYSETYATLPANASPLTLKTTALNSSSDKTDLFFAARVDLTKPSGSYRGTAVFTAVGNYTPGVPTPVGPCYNGEIDSPCMVVMNQWGSSNDENLFPIKYTGTNASPEWRIADVDVPADWYDYGAKKWANAVVVTDATLDYYLTAPPETVIPEEDIVAYYVYVPRFAYEVQRSSPTNYAVCGDGAYSNSACSDTSATTFNIMFQSQDDNESMPYGVTGNGTGLCETYVGAYKDCAGGNSRYYTHPGFSNQTLRTGYIIGTSTINGLWVGKFESSSSSSATTDNNYSANTIDDDVVIKPNVFSRRNQDVSSQHDSAKLIKPSGFTDWTNETFLATDQQWSAISYLTNSIYGAGSEPWINNCYSSNSSSTSPRYVTGISGNSANEAYTSGPCYSLTSIDDIPVANQYFGSIGVKASSTGNVYGIYDLAGAAAENTTGNFSSSVDLGGYALGTIGGSGFQAAIYYSYYANYLRTDQSGDILDSRFTIYRGTEFTAGTSSGNYNLCTFNSCAGAGLYEASFVYSVSSGAQSWNNAGSTFVTPSSPWVFRGTKYDDSSSGTLFFRNSSTGAPSSSNGYRVIMHNGHYTI